MLRYFIIFKPYQVLSQFSPEEGKQTLKNIFNVPNDVYPVGRLDYDSEGLLILTNDKQLNHRLLNPQWTHEREYWVQVDGAIDEAALNSLRAGVTISLANGPYNTRACKAEKFIQPPAVPERNPPVRFRKNIPTSWIKLMLTEGKNRQVRKMTAKVGFPTLRLIRHRIVQITTDGLQPGDMCELNRQQLYSRLFGEQ